MVDITSEITEYINYQNSGLWDELKIHYEFRLLYDPNEFSWKGGVEDRKAIIITPNKNINYFSFTHELLHIYMNYKGISLHDELLHNIIGGNSFVVLTKENLIGYIHNFCSHKKMFPYYKEMGFSEYEFVSDRINFRKSDLYLIKFLFLFKQTRLKAVNQFIGHTFSLLNNVVKEDELKCLNNLDKLHKSKPKLFEIIKDFDNEWILSEDLNLKEPF